MIAASYLICLVGFTTVILFGFSSLRHALFQSTALDLAFFDQLVYLASQGLPSVSSLLGFHLIGDHAAFILYVIALFYKIKPDVHWLFLIQAIALAAGAIPIYALSRQANLSIIHSRAIALAYCLYPAIFNINFYTDFRPEAIAVPSLFWAIWAALARKIWQFILAIVLVLICKDILSLTVVALGIWLVISEKRVLYGCLCLFLGTIWFIFTILYLVPELRGGEAGGVVFYGSLGNSFTEIALKTLTKPNLILGQLFLPDRLFYYFLLILPIIIAINWRQIITILPAIPMLLLNSISDYSAQRDLIHHYSLPVFPFLFIWLIRSLEYFQSQKQRKWLKPKWLIIWAIISFIALAKYSFFWTRYLSSLSNLNAVRTAVSLVSNEGGVITNSRIAPHLSHRPVIKIIDNQINLEQIQNQPIEYIMIDSQNLDRNISPKLIQDFIEQLKQQPNWILSYSQEQVFLFERKSSVHRRSTAVPAYAKRLPKV
jgi:uncharacterized membrane protein